MSEYSVDEARIKLDEFITSLENLVPNPSTYRLLDLDKEYTPQELRDLLQRYGSYLANLFALEARIEAEALLVKRGLKTSMSVAITQLESKTNTIKGREAEVMAVNSGFRDLNKIETYNDAYFILIKGWREAYQQGYTTVSRLISLLLGEVEHLSLRSN